MRQAIGWIKNLLVGEKKEIIISGPEIDAVLPHRMWIKLLDEIRINERKIVGHLLIRPEICEGHVIAGVPILPGALLFDMAAQLFAMMIYKDERVLAHMSPGMMLAALEYGGATFIRRARVGDRITISADIEMEDPEVDSHGILKIVHGMFFVRSAPTDKGKGGIIARITSVTLTPVKPEDLQ